MKAIDAGCVGLDYPAEMLASAVQLAERDAENVSLCITTLVGEMQKNGVLNDAKIDLSTFPAAWLLDLGAALRLVEWESNRLPLDCLNLPCGDAALTSVLHRWGVPDPQLTLFRQVSDAYFKHFAWTGAMDLGGDFVLSPIDEQCFAEQIAQFLWKHRNFLESHNETHG